MAEDMLVDLVPQLSDELLARVSGRATPQSHYRWVGHVQELLTPMCRH